MTADALDLDLASGRVRAERRNAGGGPPVLCVHGLSANLRGFDVLGAALAEAGHDVVALDLRGRGASEITPPGTYGLAAHARDVLDVATALGLDRFALVGWSLGAMIAMECAVQGGERLTHAVLLDAAGRMEQAGLDAVRNGLARLQAVVPSPEAYLEAIRAVGLIDPWHEQWDGYYRYELSQRDDGSWSARTSYDAALEDFERGVEEDLEARWPALTMPTLLVRCDAPLAGGLIVPPDVGERFAATVPDSTVLSVASGHFSVMTDPATVAGVTDHLRR